MITAGMTGIQSGANGGSALGNVLSLANPVSAVLTGLNQVASLVGLNSSDPVRDQQRIDRINLAFTLAMRGDNSPQVTLSGKTGAAYLEYIATNNRGMSGPDGVAVYGSQVAYRYAQLKYGEYKARVAAGQIGVGLIGESDIPAKVEYFFTSSTGTIVLVLLVIAGIVWFIRSRGRS